jgi:hypothetical protein
MSGQLFQFFINFLSSVAASLAFLVLLEYLGTISLAVPSSHYQALKLFRKRKLWRGTLLSLSIVVVVNVITSGLAAVLVARFFRTDNDQGSLPQLVLLHSLQGAMWAVATFVIYSAVGAFVVVMARKRSAVTVDDLPACFTAGCLAGAIIGEHILVRRGASVQSLFESFSPLSLVCLVLPAAALAFGFGLLVGYLATGMASASVELQFVYLNRYRFLALGVFLVAVFFALVFRFNPNSFLRQALSYDNTIKIWGAHALALLIGFVLGLESYTFVLQRRFIVEFAVERGNHRIPRISR